MSHHLCVPDYTNTNVNVVASILKKLKIDTQVTPNQKIDEILSKDYETIMFFILDGLGYDFLMNQKGILKDHCISKLSAVFPPTTACATTSIHTCSFPEDHGWLGWSMYFENEQREIELFMNRDKYSKEYFKQPIYVEKYLQTTNIYEKMDDKKILNYTFYPRFIQSKQTGKGAYVYDELEDLFPKLRSVSLKDEFKFAMIYYPYPDGLMHKYGTTSQEVLSKFDEMNHFFEKLQSLENTLIIATADHGLIDSKQIVLNDYKDVTSCLEHEISNDPRFPNFFVKEGKEDEFVQAFNHHFGESFQLMEKDEFLKLKPFGPMGKEEHTHYIGDFVAIATASKVLEQYRHSVEDTHNFKAEHSGMTPFEMEIPLIVIETERKSLC